MRLARFCLHVPGGRRRVGGSRRSAPAPRTRGSRRAHLGRPGRAATRRPTRSGWCVRPSSVTTPPGVTPPVEYYNDPRRHRRAVVRVSSSARNGVRLANANRPDLLGISLAGRPRRLRHAVRGPRLSPPPSRGAGSTTTSRTPRPRRPEQKHTWVVRHDGLIFGSGWYDVGRVRRARPRRCRAPTPGTSWPRPSTATTPTGPDYAIRLPQLAREPRRRVVRGHHQQRRDQPRQRLPPPTWFGTDISNLTDTTGKNFGQEIMATPPEGVWIDYLFPHPETGEDTSKHSWGVRHDDLLFGAGWYDSGEVPPRTNVAGYTQYVVHEAVERYVADGPRRRRRALQRPGDHRRAVVRVRPIDGDGTMLALPSPSRPTRDRRGRSRRRQRQGPRGRRSPPRRHRAGSGWDYYSVDPVDGETKLKYALDHPVRRTAVRLGLVHGPRATRPTTAT